MKTAHFLPVSARFESESGIWRKYFLFSKIKTDDFCRFSKRNAYSRTIISLDFFIFWPFISLENFVLPFLRIGFAGELAICYHLKSALYRNLNHRAAHSIWTYREVVFGREGGLCISNPTKNACIVFSRVINKDLTVIYKENTPFISIFQNTSLPLR